MVSIRRPCRGEGRAELTRPAVQEKERNGILLLAPERRKMDAVAVYLGAVLREAVDVALLLAPGEVGAEVSSRGY